GPTPLPLLGIFFSVDTAQPWLTFNTWRSTYGDIIYARLLNKPVIVINSEEVAKDLFEGRSHIYSDRPKSILYEPFAVDFNIVYHALQLRSAHKMLFSFLQDPDNYSSHFQTCILSFMLTTVYDYELKAKEDRIVDSMIRYADLVIESLAPGPTALMETFPFLLQLPSWFPGATFKRASVKCIQAGYDTQELPFQNIRERMVNYPINRGSKTDEPYSLRAAQRRACTFLLLMFFLSLVVSETTTFTLHVFLLAMVLNPEVQAKAQAEIDRVVGKDRLPDFDDRLSLPYLDAVLRETLRWYPVAPFGIPHATTTSDIYKDCLIPKGLAMTHDEKKYPSPNEFKPERFLHEDGSLTSDTMPLGFGWGRRACVGRHVADTSLWIAITSFLAVFSAHKALDEHGMDIPVVPKFSTGIVIHPEKFPLRIVPRFPDTSARTLMQLTGLGPYMDTTWGIMRLIYQ
ncbi:hypothetical protein CY34DRAFT_758908, partial [Suillus luteus UH-Slu-Lm8-n1]